MKHSWMKRLSILLVLVMLFQMLPHQVLAETISTEDSDLSVTPPSAETTITQDAQVVDEVVENRTEFTKEFQMNNGFSMAVVYPEAVHLLLQSPYQCAGMGTVSRRQHGSGGGC